MISRTTKYCLSLLMVMIMAISFFSPFALQVKAESGGEQSQVEVTIDGEGSSAEDPGGGADGDDVIEGGDETIPPPDEEIEYLNELAWPDGMRMSRAGNVVNWEVDRSVTRATNPSAGVYIEVPGESPARYMNLASDYAYVGKVYVDGALSFCIEPSIVSASGVSLPVSDPNLLFSFNQQRRIAEVMHYTKALGGESDTGMYFAGQVLIWEIANRAVDYSTLAHNGSFMNLYEGGIAGRFDAQYNAIKQAVIRHSIIPSFMKGAAGLAPEYTIPVSYFEGAKVLGEITLEDTNGVVDQMSWPTSDPYFTFHVIDAHHLRIKAKPAAANLSGSHLVGPVMKTNANIMEMLVIGDGPGGTQDIGQCVVSSDPVPAYMRLRIGDGPGVEVSKTDSEEGFVIGSGDSASSHYAAQVRVDESPGGFMNGQVISLPYVFTTPGSYKLTEIHAAAFADPHLGYYNDGAIIRFTIGSDGVEDWDGNGSGGSGNSGDTDMENTRQKGQIIIQKVDAYDNYINHWNVYRDLTDLGNGGNAQNASIAATSSGSTTYTRSSADPSIDGRSDSIYDIYDTFSHDGIWYMNETTVENDLKGPIVNPKAQGDASLAGAVFTVTVSEQNGKAADGRRGIYLANGKIARGETFSYDAATDTVTSLGVNDLVAGAIVAVISTDENGVAKTNTKLELGIYDCQEVRVSKGYQFPDYAPEGKVVVVDNHFTDEDIKVNVHEFNYDNDVMKGHIEFTKVLEGTVTNNPNNTGSQRNARDIYFGIYLNSKTAAPRIAGDDVLDEQGNPGGTYDNDTQLPGEYFVQRDMDPDAPISFNTGQKDQNGWDIWVRIDENGNTTTESINPTDAFAYDQNVYNAYYKELYMVVKTNSNGFASTRDDATIVWCAIGGYENGGGLLNDADSSLVAGAMPLPYGQWTVVEYNPNEGFEAIKSVTINIDERAAMDNSDGGYDAPGGKVLRRPELGAHPKTGEIEQNGRFGAEWDLLGNCYPYNFDDDEPYEGDKENIVKDQIVRQRIQVVKVDNETFSESEAVAAYRYAMENYRAKLAQYQKALLAFEEEVKTNPGAVKPVEPVKPKLEDFNIRGIISDKALSGITVYTSEQLREMGYTATGDTRFLIWSWYNDSAAAGNTNYPGARDYSMIGNFAYGEWIVQSIGGEAVGTFSNPWKTDRNGQFELQYPLVYGDYTLIEVSSSYGMWLPDAITGEIEDIINELAGVTREQIEQYLVDKAAFDVALAKYIKDLNAWHTALLAVANNTTERSYDELAKLDKITWDGKTYTRPPVPVEPLRPGHTGGNIDVENVIKDENGNPQPWIIDPSTGDWYVDEYGNTYAPKTNMVNFSVEADDTPQLIDDVYLYNRFISIFYENENQKGYVELYKEGHQLVGSETQEHTVHGKTYTETRPVFESRPVSGTEYQIFARKDIVTPDQEVRHRAGDLVATIETDGRGIAVSKPLYLGEYYILETKSGYGFIRDPKQYDFTLEYQGQNIRIFPERQFFFNIRQNVEFQFLKEREVAGEGLGATDLTKSKWVPASGMVFGLFAREDILAYDGSVAIQAGSLVEHIVVEDGKGISTLDLPIGKYYLKELDVGPNKDLQLDETEYDIEFEYDADGYGNGETVVIVRLGDGAVVRNYLKRGSVEILKTDSEHSEGEDAIYLEGAEFTLYDESGTARAVIVTQKGGIGRVDNLPYGRYILHETKGPEGWRLSEDEWEVVIDEHGVVISFKITNVADVPQAKVKKKDTSGNRLSGAVFEIWRCENPEVIEAYRKALAEYVAAMEAYAEAYAEFEEVQKKAIANGEEPPAPPVKPEKPEMVVPVWTLYMGPDKSTAYRYTTSTSGEIMSGELEDGLYRLVEVSPPMSYSGVFDKEFTIVAEEMERPRILTFEAVNYKDEPGPDYGKVTEDKPDKEYPKTGDAEDDSITETAIIPTEGNIPTGHDFPETIKRDGATYELVEVSYRAVEVPLEKTVEYTELDSKQVPKTIEAEYGGEMFLLDLADISYAQMNPPETVSHHEDYGYTLAEPRAPEQITVFMNGEEVLLQMVSLELAEDYTWRPVNIKAYFYGHSEMAGVALGTAAMPYSNDTPILEGYEDAVLAYLGKDPTQTRIIGARWLDDGFGPDASGNSVRTAIIVTEQRTARWIAHYGIPSDGTVLYDATATYKMGTEGEFKYEATAIYIPKTSKGFPIWLATAGAVVLGGGIAGIVIFVRRREKAAYDSE